MILVPSRWATRPACATRPLEAGLAPAAPADAPIKWSTRPVCATRRLAVAPAPVLALVPTVERDVLPLAA